MKKLFILLAAVGLFASCSKEEPVASVANEEQLGIDSKEPPVPADATSTDPNALQFNFAFEADVDDFEVANESLSGDQEIRSVDPQFVPNQDPKKQHAFFMRLRLQADSYEAGTGDPRVMALVYIYDNKGNQAYFLRYVKYREETDGTKLYHDSNVVVEGGNTPGSLLGLKRMQENGFANAKMALIIGFDTNNAVSGRKFINKGAVLATYGQTMDLPKGFVMLKSENNDVELHPGRSNSIRVKPTLQPDGSLSNKIKLKLQGYILGIRFKNTFPEKMRKMREWTSGQNPTPDANRLVTRPDLPIHLRINGLSAILQNDVTFSTQSGTFGVKPSTTGPAAAKQYVYNTPGITEFNLDAQGRKPRYSYYVVRHMVPDPQKPGEFYSTSSPIKVPTNKATERQDHRVLDEGEQVVLLYCPNPQDAGSIGYEAQDKLFYDGSFYSSARQPGQPDGSPSPFYFYLLEDKKNKIKKDKQGDGKVYLPMFNIAPARKDRAISLTQGKSHPEVDAIRATYNARSRNLK